MLKFKYLILPTDLSSRSACIASHAVAFARRFDPAVTILHVVEPIRMHHPLGGVPVDLDDVQAARERLAREQLDRFLDKEMEGLAVTRVLDHGDPARQIELRAHAEQATLVMMPTHGYGPFRRFVLGSVTAKVLHDVHCPIWTAAHVDETASHEPADPKVIVCAVDLRPESVLTVHWAAELATAFNARLVIAHAIPALQFGYAISQMAGEVRKVLERGAVAEAANLLQGSRLPDAEVRVEEGDVASVVGKIAEESKADLLVIGRAGSTGALGRLRTHSYAMIRDSPCPVISL